MCSCQGCDLRANTLHHILMRRRLDALPLLTNGRVRVTHIVSSADNVHWNGLTGLVNKDLIAQTMPKPSDDVMVYTCGPPGFMDLVSGNKAKDFSQGEVSGVLKELGFNKNNVYKF
jgi:cytochrome-b5 reductase